MSPLARISYSPAAVFLIMLALAGCREPEPTKVLPTVTTGTPFGIRSTSAILPVVLVDDGGAKVTVRGLMVGLSPDILSRRTIGTDRTASYMDTLKGLEPSTTYFARAYAVNEVGKGVGEIMSFTTLQPSIPTVTAAWQEIRSTSVGVRYSILDDGGADVTEHGLLLGLADDLANAVPLGAGTGSFEGTLQGLSLSTDYFVRAYAVNSVGTGYSDLIGFKTQPAIVQLGSILTDITAASAVIQIRVFTDGGSPITAKGATWGPSFNPTVEANQKTDVGPGSESAISFITGLSTATTYWIRQYAINGSGVWYSTGFQFSTKAAEPTTVYFYHVVASPLQPYSITLKNNSGVEKDISGWSITMIPTPTYTIPAGPVLGQGDTKFFSEATLGFQIDSNNNLQLKDAAGNAVATWHE